MKIPLKMRGHINFKKYLRAKKAASGAGLNFHY